VNTREWLDEKFYKPVAICSELKGSFDGEPSRKVYQHLANFGMYKPSRKTKEIYDALVKKDVWAKCERLYLKYKRLWKGPEIPIYIFPFNQSSRSSDNKSGLSFPDMLFLFIGDIEEDKELEALFIHEYHHVCRIYYQKKDVDDYNLLDSIILEGLAEHAVKNHCGEKYNADWCRKYKEDDLEIFWENYLQENLDINKSEYLHDALLFGLGSFPEMLGYCYGFHLITKFRKQKSFPEKTYFDLRSEEFLM